MKWGYQGNFKPVYFFFYEKISHEQKHKQTLTNKTKLRKHKIFKTTIFRANKLLRGWELPVLRFSTFMRAKSFRKKNKQGWNCLDNLISLYYYGELVKSIVATKFFRSYHFPKIHRSVLRKITIDLLYFWAVYDVNLWEKNFGRSTASSCRTNIFI